MVKAPLQRRMQGAVVPTSNTWISAIASVEQHFLHHRDLENHVSCFVVQQAGRLMSSYQVITTLTGAKPASGPEDQDSPDPLTPSKIRYLDFLALSSLRYTCSLTEHALRLPHSGPILSL